MAARVGGRPTRKDTLLREYIETGSSASKKLREENELQTDTNASLIEAARGLAPLIQEHNEEAERESRLSPPVLAALHETGLLRMVTPKSLGGLEVDPVTRALVIE